MEPAVSEKYVHETAGGSSNNYDRNRSGEVSAECSHDQQKSD
jgi:hypothetical protein